ncbi:hypothetical protein B0H14DRAFT_2565752 [Mycena olivaceomarginata]|nr:hypothetical protein B0H14DRAFT_2565752 [Mycena olivaceomarginata]
MAQDFDEFTKISDKRTTITAVGKNGWGEDQTYTRNVYTYLGNPMPGKPLDEREFVCLGSEGLYKFMLLKDLEDRIVWKNSTAPDCYAADMAGTSKLTLWELEGDRWEISKTDELWSEWFGKHYVPTPPRNGLRCCWPPNQSGERLVVLPLRCRGRVRLGEPIKPSRNFVVSRLRLAGTERDSSSNGYEDAQNAHYLELDTIQTCQPWATRTYVKAVCSRLHRAVKANDITQWNSWSAKALAAGNSNTLLGFPKFARFWTPQLKTQSHFVFEPVDDTVEEPLRRGLEKHPTISWEVVSPESDQGAQGRVLWATHYLGFYKIWVSLDDYNALVAAQGDDTKGTKWTFPSDTVAEIMNAATSTPQDRSLVDDQGTVMGVAPGKMCNLLNKSAPDQLKMGCGRLNFEALEGGVSTQTRRNLVLGTSEANTYMILLENAIADYVARTNTEGKLVTRVKYAQDWNLPKYTWLAPTLEYEFTFKFGTVEASLLSLFIIPNAC